MRAAPAPTAGSQGPIVQRRVGGNSIGSNSKALQSNPSSGSRLKPTIRQTIESITSTGSQAEYFRPEQTIILFDWDDTLCPSNWIRENRPALSFFKPCPPEEKYQRPLRELQKHVEATLQLAMKMGKVIIVTNAMEPWVETSCRNFLPALVPIVSQIQVIYARSVFDTMTCDAAKVPGAPGRALPRLYAANGMNKLGTAGRAPQQIDEMAPQRWKEIAFEQEISGFYSRYAHQSWKNVISIGDSIFERDAVRRVVINRPTANRKCRTKTAKLLDEPEIDELVAQVKVVHDALGLMVQYDGNLDIEIDEEDLKLDLSLAEKIMDR
mmetsp:Transcript_65988/g.144743  ORF Transcript_65988/g.144743 Transcript_65988/m.144743 type:complete len:324 (+) Transcript_65988:52-1023(+)